MAHDNEADQQRGAANRLYWESDASVAEIAEKLGLSRRALYDAVHPEPAGAACPKCRAGMVFRTRTSRMLGETECPECGLEEDIETLREATAEAGAAMRREADEREAPEAKGRETVEAKGREAPDAKRGEALATDARLRERAAWLGGAALAGAVVGAITAWIASRR